MKQKIHSGFTLIELLVVIAIIGILSTLAIVALGSARQKARDSKRVADLSQVSKALELYYNDNNDYPTIITAGQAIASGSNVYMAAVPSNPTPRADNGCSESDYQYGYITGSYTFGACLGSGTGALGAGPAWATPEGINSNRDGLVGFWKLNEGSGTTTADSSGNGSTASVVASPAWTSSSGCKYSNCLVFSSAGDYVGLPHNSFTNVTGKNASFGGWVNFTGINASTILIHKNVSYEIYASTSGTSLCAIGTGAAWDNNTAAFTAPSSGWHHIFCTYNGANLKLFIDGDLKASAALTINMSGNVTPPRIGVRSDVISSEINTGIDNVRLYNIALSNAQVKALYLNDSDN